MAFKRNETAVPAVDLAALTAREAERKIIDGVRKYATHQENWAKADKNTPFLGHIIGMGIESSNLVDITMSMERQFLTRRDGEPVRLRILEGQDVYAATPGLAVKMLMEHGHMKPDPDYLKDAVSFAHVVVIGEGHRLAESITRALGKLQNALEPAVRQDAQANLKALLEAAREYADTARTPESLARARKDAYLNEKRALEELEAEIGRLGERVKELSASSQTEELERSRSRQMALQLRLNSAQLKLKVAARVCEECSGRSSAEEERIQAVRRVLQAACESAQATAHA